MSEERHSAGDGRPVPTRTPGRTPKECAACGARFVLSRPAQRMELEDGSKVYACSEACRQQLRPPTARGEGGPRIIALINQKGGTAKTTSSVTLAAGLAARGAPTLLVDADPQGSVGVFFGVRTRYSLYHLLVDGVRPKRAAVSVRPRLDVITSERSLAQADLRSLGEHPERIMRERFSDALGPSSPYQFILIDCAPSVSLLNQNVLSLAEEVLMPVSCDYMALVGARQLLRTLHHMNELLGHELKLLGVLPTFFQPSDPANLQAFEALGAHFGDKRMPPIHLDPTVRTAPSVKQTIFEHKPDSRAARDYSAAVRWLTASTPGCPPPQLPEPPRAPTEDLDRDRSIDLEQLAGDPDSMLSSLLGIT